jgi:hypothetical protein
MVAVIGVVMVVEVITVVVLVTVVVVAKPPTTDVSVSQATPLNTAFTITTFPG